MTETNKERERATLVIAATPANSKSIYEDLDELKRLASTAGAEVIKSFTQIREHFEPAFVIGRGKLEEIAEFVKNSDIDVVIFYNNLSQSQRRNINKFVKCKVIDRTELILDIFALHAKTLEAKLQVELAQHIYRLSHLTGKGLQLMQQTGGIGARGPGEKKLEIDRRRIRERITKLKRDLDKIRSQRQTRRARRVALPIPTVSLVGYTNAGKSTLMRQLTKSKVLVADKLFATLTTTTRKLLLSGKKTVLISDTVGFIKNLPHNLIASFRSTLEEVETSDLLLHVIDASAENVWEQYDSVMKVLDEIGLKDVEIINVINKIDIAPESIVRELLHDLPDAVPISALRNRGIDDLIKKIDEKISSFYGKYRVKLNMEKDGAIIGKLKKYCYIVAEEYKNNLIDLTFIGHKNIIKSIFKQEMTEYECKD